MAEKEKRIRIEQFEYKGFGHCGGFTTDGVGYYCDFGVDTMPINKEFCEKNCPFDNSISRQEAIEKMAKAMCHSPFQSCEGCIVQKKKQACKQALEGMKDLAEVALNALLSK